MRSVCRGGRRPDEELMAEKRQQLVADLRHAGVQALQYRA